MSHIQPPGVICDLKIDNKRTASYLQFDIGGTIFFRTTTPITEEESIRYSCGMGEIYLCNLNPNINPKRLMQIFLQVGEVYIFRFKITVLGLSRGYAFLQYRNTNLVQLAISKIPALCRAIGVPHVRATLNLRTNSLWLQNTDHGHLSAMLSKMRQMNVPMQRIIAYEYDWNQYEFEIRFKCNRDVARGWHFFNMTKTTFGRNTRLSLNSNNIPHTPFPRCKPYSQKQCLSKSMVLCTIRLNDL